MKSAQLRPVLDVRYVAGSRSGRILAAWPNGLVVVSGNLREGGAPYRCFSVPKQQVGDACAHMNQCVSRFAGRLSDAGPDASFTRVRVSTGSSVCTISSMNMAFSGETVARSPVARREFQDLWLELCLEANALDRGERGLSLARVDDLPDP